MGHTWREMFPGDAAVSDRRWDRILKLRKKLEDLPLSNFTVGDFAALYRVMGVDTHHRSQDASEEDIVRLEKKVQKIKKKP